MEEVTAQITMDNAQLALSWVPTIALAVSLAACAGLRAFLPLLIAGGLSRFGVLQLGEGYNFIGSTPALALFSVATVLEIVGDKIPAVDHALDAVGTAVRPIAGSLLAASVMWQINEPMWAMVLGVIVGAPTALAPHAAKSATRAASSTFSLGIANPVLSVIEDFSAAALAVVAIVVPVVSALFQVASCFVLLLVFRRMISRRNAKKDAAALAAAGA